MKTTAVSVVVPLHNEVESIRFVVEEIVETLEGHLDYEVLCVDDGSTDGTAALLAACGKRQPRLRVIRHRQCFGQSAAIVTGVRAARFPWIITMDGDGQNNPSDILRLIAVHARSQLPRELKLVAGSRHKRRDGWWKRMCSRSANAVRRRLLRDEVTDTGCGLKLLERQAFLALPVFDHMHRFLPALIRRGGWELVVVEVDHRPRRRGRSKYGLHNRLWVGIVDVFGVLWLQRRRLSPEVLGMPMGADRCQGAVVRE